jgi:hypothetical protein
LRNGTDATTDPVEVERTCMVGLLGSTGHGHGQPDDERDASRGGDRHQPGPPRRPASHPEPGAWIEGGEGAQPVVSHPVR